MLWLVITSFSAKLKKIILLNNDETFNLKYDSKFILVNPKYCLQHKIVNPRSFLASFFFKTCKVNYEFGTHEISFLFQLRVTEKGMQRQLIN